MANESKRGLRDDKNNDIVLLTPIWLLIAVLSLGGNLS